MKKGMTPDTFREAAERLGLRTKVLKKAGVSGLSQSVLPAVAILKGGQAVVITARPATGSVKLYDPVKQQVVDIREADLEKLYAGYAILIHPEASFTDPGAAHYEDTDRSWFWPLGAG
jgi:ATP-binding cassette subfamily C protein LapB